MAKKILVVEDEAKLREIYKETLTEEGYEVVLTDNGRKALTVVRGARVDLIITDIKMPEMHGVEFVTELRNAGFNTPVIMCSAYEQMKDDFDVVNAGIADFLTKPVDIDELVTKVNAILGSPAS
ncbi:response regulator [bacterium]|nr:response regulator [bacterium]